MKAPQHVLFPTDLSDASKSALSHAIQIARGFGADLHILTVQEMHSQPVTLSDLPGHAELTDALAARTTELVDRLIDTAPQTDLVIHRAARQAVAAGAEILLYAEQNHIDLIVMATRGLRGLQRLFLGSVTEEVVRFADIPVMTVQAEGAAERAEKYETEHSDRFSHGSILVPIDFEDHAKDAIAHAERFSAWTGAEVELLHVVQPPMIPVVYEALPEIPLETTEELRKESRERLDALCASSGIDPDRCTVRVSEGDPGREILRRVEEGEIQLVILASRSRRGLGYFVHGSVAVRVLSKCPAPVLTFKDPVEDNRFGDLALSTPLHTQF